MPKIVVVGSINIDLTVRLDRWPTIGETVFGTGSSTAVGGKGANQAVAASRLGAEAVFVGAIGGDAFGEMARQTLVKNDVRVELIEVDQDTGLAFIDVGPGGDNIIRLSPGANGALQPAHIDDMGVLFEGAKVVLLQNEIGIDASRAAAKLGRDAGALIVMDPAPAPVPMWTKEVFSDFDLVTPNSSEAGVILGKEPRTLGEGEEAAGALSRTVGTDVVVTMGELGTAWHFAGSSGHAECKKVDAIDTVAAGDCFNGALATAIADGATMGNAIDFASLAAGLATTRLGAIVSLPYLKEIE